jgi:hypothetical protein
MERVEVRLDHGQERFAAIEAVLGTLATSERAAITGAIEATRRPGPSRPGRATDPSTERTGWRE